MHILVDMNEMTFYSLDELNDFLLKKVNEENRKNFEGLSYSRFDLFNKEEKETLLPLPETRYEYLERKIVTVAQDFSFIYDKVHYSMPRKYLRQKIEIRAGENEIFVYNKQGDLIRTHKRSYNPKDWVIIAEDMPAQYQDYGFWSVPFFQNKASGIGPSTRHAIEIVIKNFKYPVQSFRCCLGIINLASKYSKEALENCCKSAIAAERCNYTYINNTVSMYHKPKINQPPVLQPQERNEVNTGKYKDNDSKYSLKNLLAQQNMEVKYGE